MELIPILSLIMLVATIATFILAIGAYILYKIRERNGRTEETKQPDSVSAELITPSFLASETEGKRETYTGDLGIQNKRYSESNEGIRGPRMRQTIVRPMYSNIGYKKEKEPNKASTVDSDKQKYLRYTQDGYVEPNKDKNKENVLKWR